MMILIIENVQHFQLLKAFYLNCKQFILFADIKLSNTKNCNTLIIVVTFEFLFSKNVIIII